MARGVVRAWVRRRRRQIVLACLLLLIVFRVALPYIVRRVIVSQANQAVAGRLDVGDVDLWLLRGGVALEDVALHREGAAADDPPLAAWHRLYLNVGWLSFPWHTVRVQDVELDGLVVNVDRLKDGTLVLPAPRPSAAPPAPAATPPEAPAATPWNIVVDRAALAAGSVRVRDYVADPPERVELGLPALDVKGFTFQYSAEAKPGHGLVEARFGDGHVRLKTSLARRQDGVAASARVQITNLPLDRAQVHVPQLGWSGLAGHLDALVDLRVDPRAPPVAAGTVALRELRIDVPGEDEPALAWRRLDVEAERIDILGRTAHLARVALDGGRVLVRPRQPGVVPIVPRPREVPAEPPPAPPETGGEPAPPWRWRVAKLEVADTTAKVFLEPPPLEIGIVRATVTGLSSEPGATAELALEVREGEGTVALEGTVGLDPVAARLTTRLSNVALERLVAASGAAPLRFPSGTVSGELRLAADAEPLTIAGQLVLADLAARPLEGEDFALGWTRLELGAREIAVPGVLPGRAPAAGPMRVDLDSLRLTAPVATLTRTPEGLLLPGAKPAETAPPPAETAPAEAPPPTEAPPAAAPTLQLALASFDLERGDVTVVDRAVKPFYRGRISDIALKARGLRFPENVFDEFSLALRTPGNAPLTFKGNRVKDGVQLEANVRGMPLAQFNPYVTPSGYSLTRGALTFSSRVRWGAARYQADNRIEFQQLAVAGTQGDSLFLQRFGVPLSLALALMRDVHGKIALGVPVKGDRARGMRIDLASVVTQALARAIVNAVASPLKLIGAVVLEGDKVGAIAPEPIGFAPGRPEPGEGVRARLEQVASLLGTVPGVRIGLRGVAAAPDVRALQEADVLADLEADQGMLGTIRNLPARRERNAIRDALRARARGEASELAPEHQARLDEWVAQKSIPDDRLRELATARAERVRKLLAEDFGVASDRLATEEPTIDREQGRPEVAVAVNAG